MSRISIILNSLANNQSCTSTVDHTPQCNVTLCYMSFHSKNACDVSEDFSKCSIFSLIHISNVQVYVFSNIIGTNPGIH